MDLVFKEIYFDALAGDVMAGERGRGARLVLRLTYVTNRQVKQ